MKMRFLQIVAAAISLAVAGQGWGQGETPRIDLEFSGENNCRTIFGVPGSAFNQEVDCILTTFNNDTVAGAQGWSISVTAEGGTITGITTEGTVGANVAEGGMRSVGFEKTEMTTRSGVTPGGANDCDGLNGAVSAVVLTFTQPSITLEPNGSATIARINVNSAFPGTVGERHSVRVFYADGCRGAGQPVRNAVTLNAQTIIPSLGSCEMELSSRPNPGLTHLSFSDGHDNNTIEGISGSPFNRTVDCILRMSNNDLDEGAEGWSISVAAEGSEILSITVDGTVAADERRGGGFRRGGFERSETTTESEAGSDCEGFNGAVSAVILSFTQLVTLPPNGSEIIARINVNSTFPGALGGRHSVRVFYADGCLGAGQPVRNQITLNNRGIIPSLGSYEVYLLGTEICDNGIDDDEDGDFDCNDEDCAGNQACIDVVFDLSFSGENSETITGFVGETFNQTIDCTLATTENRTGLGSQGWSISIAGSDPDLDIVGISIDGTAAADERWGGFRRGGFEKTELTSGEGNAGAISAVVLSFTELVTLPASGSEVIARIDIQCPFPAADVTETRVVRYVDGLQGSGLPVTNVIIHGDFGISPGKAPYEVTLFGTDENALTYDCNTDGLVNIADAQCLLNWMFLGGVGSSCRDAMDFNGDGRLNIADGISGLDFLFMGGPPPASGVGCQPYPECDLQDACAF